jgi:hypothetical protein
MQSDGPQAFLTAAWMPDWYMGDPLRTYYPPLTTILLTPIVYLLQDPLLSFKLVATLALAAFGTLSFIFLDRIWGRWPAAFGASIAIWAPYQLRTLFFEGNLPRVLSLIALPVIAWATERLLLTASSKMRYLSVLAIGWFWALLSHAQQGVMFAIGFGIYVVCRMLLDPEVPLKRATIWVSGIAFGIMLSAPWALPAYGKAELSNVPFLPAEKVELFSAPLSSILPMTDVRSGAIQLGAGALIMAVLSVAARPDARRSAWLLASLATAWLSLGSTGIAFNLLPLNDQLLPERFLNFTGFGLAVAAAGLVPMLNRARVARAVVVTGLVLMDGIPSFALISGGPYPSAPSVLAQNPEGNLPAAGRTALMTYPEPTALDVYFAGQHSNLIGGWGLENTPHHEQIRRVLGAPEWSHQYLDRLFSMWNVQQVVVRGDSTETDSILSFLAEAGFEGPSTQGEFEIWRGNPTGSPVQEIPSDRMLVIGERPHTLLMVYPFAEESTSAQLSAHTLDELSRYSAIALVRFGNSRADLRKSEAILEQYLISGGVVVADLSGMEGSFSRSLGFLGVNTLRLSLEEPFNVRWSEALEGLESPKSTGGSIAEAWSGPTFTGLDVVLAEVEFDDRWFPVLGYRQVGEGRIWFVGLNLLYYAQLTQSTDFVTAIRDITLTDVDLSRDTGFEALSVAEWTADGNGLSFTVDAGGHPIEEALVSYTFSPRWQALIDGEEVPFSDYEHLIKLSLPPGIHLVEIRYNRFGTVWPLIGFGVGVLGAAVLVSGNVLEGRRAQDPRAAQSNLRTGREMLLAPCGNCGFRFSEVVKQAEDTDSREVPKCPICGSRPTLEGSQPGVDLSVSDRFERLGIWLKRHGYEPSTVHGRWDFPPGDFFVPGSLELSTSSAANDGTREARLNGRINLNLADAAEIQKLPRIGKQLSKRVVEYRQARGIIREPDDLLEIRGIGVRTLEAIRSLIVLL